MSSVWEPVPSNGTGLIGNVVNLVNQTASILQATLYTVPSNAPGIYRLTLDLICTQAGTGGSVSPTITWNDGYVTQTFIGSSLDLTGVGNERSASVIMNVAQMQAITYSTDVVGTVGAPAYAFDLRLEFLG